jgi:hypothetical protein
VSVLFDQSHRGGCGKSFGGGADLEERIFINRQRMVDVGNAEAADEVLSFRSDSEHRARDLMTS